MNTTSFWWSHIFLAGEIDLLIELDIDSKQIVNAQTSAGRVLTPDEVTDVQESVDLNLDLAGSWEKFQQDLIVTDF